MSVTIRRWDDPTSWNNFTSSVPFAHFQQSWEWGELAPDLGGEVIRLAALDGDRILGTMQVFSNSFGSSGKRRFYVPRGPAVVNPHLDVLGPLLDAARLNGQTGNAVGMTLEPNIPAGNKQWEHALSSLGYTVSRPPSQPRSSWVLNIDDEPDRLLASMKQKTRYNIRLASKRGVTVEEAAESDLDDFYELYKITGVRDDFFIHNKEFYARMFQVFRRAGAFCMLMAHYEGRPIAAVTLLRFGNTAWYLHGASSNEHRNVMAPYLLQWEGIQWAQRQGCALYDFRAVPDLLREDQDMYGVYRFKEGFGGRQFTTLPTFASPYQLGLFSAWRFAFRARFELTNFQRRRQGLPVRQFA